MNPEIESLARVGCEEVYTEESPALLCFPPRPVNGGSLEKAPPKLGQWFYEPKVNGWRTMVHIATGTMFNRHGQRLSIAHEFKNALAILKSIQGAATEDIEWVDCEALERRHNIGRGTLIVLDIPDRKLVYHERKDIIHRYVMPLNPHGEAPCGEGEIRSLYGDTDGMALWQSLILENMRLGVTFYEGVVAKRGDSKYPHQLRSATIECWQWQKHRWSF